MSDSLLKPSKGDEFFAPLLSETEDKTESIMSIDPGAFDYSLRCINGPFKDRFAYINLGPEGEIIGSGVGPEVSLNIEDTSVEPKHARIVFTPEYQYILSNLSKSGTWINVQSKMHIKKLLKFDRAMPLKFRVNKTTIEITVEKPEFTLSLAQWLQMHGVQMYEAALGKDGINSLEGLYNKRNNLFQDPKYTEILKLLPELKKHKIKKVLVTFKNEAKVIKNELKQKETLTIGSSPTSTFTIESEKIQATHLKIYKDRHDIVVEVCPALDPKKKNAKVWRKLHATENYCLLPEDIIRVGQVSLLVQRFNVGIVADIGPRAIMEDFYQVIHDLKISDSVHCSYYGVYDGHGGEYCAKYVQGQLPWVFKNILEKHVFQSSKLNAVVGKSLVQAFKEVDSAFHEEFKELSLFSGSTVVVVVIVGSKIYCANTGDSRAVLCKKGLAYNLSQDHKATNSNEEKRIVAAGGEVKCGRTMGKIAISRAMGDFQYKVKPVIICEPEIRVWEINPNEDEFILIGSDGLFDKFSSQEAVSYVRHQLKQMEYMEQDVRKVAKEITDEAIHKRNVRDNVTTMIIQLNRGIKDD